MAMKLLEFNVKGIEYVRGEDNILADALSRIEVGLIHAITGPPSEKLKKLMEKDPKRFQLIEGRVYLVEKEMKRLCVDTEEEKQQIFKQIHDEGGHLGFYKSSEAIRERFYWPHWKNDLKRHLKKCFACLAKKDDLEPHKEEMYPLESEDVFERVHVDLCGPLTESDGNTYILVLQDAFSKWIEATAIHDTRTATIIEWLQKEVFSRFGEPDMITSDGGSQFDSREFAEFCKNLAIEHHIASPYHHQGNGLVENAIRTLESMLRTSCEDQKEWSRLLPEMVRSYNARKHHTTGVTPHSLMFNREARTKVDRMFNLDRTDLDAEMNRSIAKVNRETEMARIKSYYDRKVKRTCVKPGELVLWHVNAKGVGKSKKLNRKWKGPYRVVEVDHPKVK